MAGIASDYGGRDEMAVRHVKFFRHMTVFCVSSPFVGCEIVRKDGGWVQTSRCSEAFKLDACHTEGFYSRLLL